MPGIAILVGSEFDQSKGERTTAEAREYYRRQSAELELKAKLDVKSAEKAAKDAKQVFNRDLALIKTSQLRVDALLNKDSAARVTREFNAELRLREKAESLGIRVGANLDKASVTKAIEEARALTRLRQRAEDLGVKVGANLDRPALLKAIEEAKLLAKSQKVKIKVDVDENSGRKAAEGFIASFLAKIGTALPGGVSGQMGAVGFASLIPIFVDLGGVAASAAQSLLLLPAAAGGAAAGIGTLALATQGFDQTMKDMGDLKKFTDDLNLLSPNAQKAAESIKFLVDGPIKELQQSTQDVFFKDVGNIATRLTNQFLPSIQGLTTGIAGAINSALSGVADQLMSPETMASIQTFLTNITETFRQLAPAVAPFVKGLVDIADVGSGFLPGLAQDVTNIANAFAQFISHAKETGQLKQWIGEGIDTVKQLGSIAWDLSKALMSLAPIGRQSLPAIVSFFHNLSEIMPTLVNLVKVMTDNYIGLFGGIRLVSDALGTFTTLLKAVVPGGLTTIESILEKIDRLLGHIMGPFQILSGAGSTGSALDNARAGLEAKVAEAQNQALTPGGSPVLLPGGSGGPAADAYSAADAAAHPGRRPGLQPGQYRRRDGSIGYIPPPSADTTGGPGVGPGSSPGIGHAEVPYGAGYGAPPSPGESTSIYNAEQSVIEAQHGVAEAHAQLARVEADGKHTADELTKAQNDVSKAAGNEVQAQLRLRDAHAQAVQNPQVPYGPGYGAAPLPGEKTEVYNAGQAVIEAQHSIAQANVRLQTIQADPRHTTDDLIKASNDLQKAHQDEIQAQLHLRDAINGSNNAVQAFGVSIEKDFGLSRGLSGLAENLVRFVGSLAAAPLLGKLSAISSAQGGIEKTGSGLIGMIASQMGIGASGSTGSTAPGSLSSLLNTYTGASKPGVTGGYPGDAALLANVPAGSYSQPGSGAWDLSKGLGDCSSAVEDLVNILDGRPTGGREMSTGNEADWLTQHGFLPNPTGANVPGAFNVGFNASHTQATLPGGTNFNWGSDSAAQRGGVSGGGAFDQGQGFTSHYYRPMGATGNQNFDALAASEASGNWANTSNPKYSGGLQFDAATWAQYGGTDFAPTAAQASKGQQIAVAQRAMASGRTPQSLWPQNYGQLNTPMTAPGAAAPMPDITNPALYDPRTQTYAPSMDNGGAIGPVFGPPSNLAPGPGQPGWIPPNPSTYDDRTFNGHYTPWQPGHNPISGIFSKDMKLDPSLVKYLDSSNDVSVPPLWENLMVGKGRYAPGLNPLNFLKGQSGGISQVGSNELLPLPSRASGGPVPILAHAGEHVLTTSDVHAMGGQSGVYAFRRGLHSYDQGGGVGSGGGSFLDQYQQAITGSKPPTGTHSVDAPTGTKPPPPPIAPGAPHAGSGALPGPGIGAQAGQGPSPIGGGEPKAFSGAAQSGGGIIGAATGAAAMAADLFAPGSGAAVQIASQEIQRAIKFGAQAVGIGVGGLLDTFLPFGGSDLAQNNWITRVAGSFAGVAPQIPNLAGKSASVDAMNKQEPPPIPTMPPISSGQGSGNAPGPPPQTVNINVHNNRATEDGTGRDIAAAWTARQGQR